ncbi:MAG: GntR family transcriptional regulator [Dermatophilaceae bacterium]|nr:GntR family transcriptional regulator [Dermatophilaceae bacterium]
MTDVTTAPRGEPKYEALRRQLLADITAGMQPHDALPTERELMARYGVSRMTVRESLSRLADEGRIYRVQGSGSYVADPGTIRKSLALTSFSEDITARRMTPGARLLHLDRADADVAVARDLALSPGDPVVRIVRLRTADGEPMCLERVWLPELLVPGLVDAGVGQSLYDALAGYGLDPQHADQTIRATVVTPEEALLLDVPAHSPALHVSRITYDSLGRAVERGHSVYRADRYDFHLSVSRRGRPRPARPRVKLT